MSYRVHAVRSFPHIIAEDGRDLGRAGMETWCERVIPTWSRDDKSDQKCVACLGKMAEVGGKEMFWASRDD